MTDSTSSTPYASSVVYGVFDGNRTSPCAPPDGCSPPYGCGGVRDTVAAPPPTKLLPSKSSEPFLEPQHEPSRVPGVFLHGKVRMNAATLRGLREARYLSQQEMVDDFERRNFRVSIATIKRAETGHDVRFRICRELARYFGVSFDDLLR